MATATAAAVTAATPELADRIELDIEGITPISFGKAFTSERKPSEDHDTFERRCWREKCHVDSDGNVIVPPIMFKKALELAAQFASESVPGKGTSKFTKHFKAGILITDPILIGIKIDDVVDERLFVSSTGKPGGPRVYRHFPLIMKWGGHVTIHLLDPTLKKHWRKVIEYSERAGQFIGLGRFAPRVGGYYGRFVVKNAEPVAAKSTD